ncbi:MAG TPA: 2OG-Fe dioxygenase family protein [Nostocaceae cyanobacterium]|nr:2OG-Fe dioxygenase family protein [Nostocaceae cyanobacterium]
MQIVSSATELEYAFLFTLRKVNSINTASFQPFFNDLPPDPFIKGNYRFRRLSRFIVGGDNFIKLPHGYLLQGQEYNPLLGNIKREFVELDQRMIELDSFKKMVLAFADSCQLHPEAEIGVHQIRTICSPENLGNPAPEGIHQDGTNFIGIFSVNRNNILGGETHLYTGKREKPIFSKILQPGELLLVNDNQFFHFTTPIKPEQPNIGIRDVFVFSSPSLIVSD